MRLLDKLLKREKEEMSAVDADVRRDIQKLKSICQTVDDIKELREMPLSVGPIEDELNQTLTSNALKQLNIDLFNGILNDTNPRNQGRNFSMMGGMQLFEGFEPGQANMMNHMRNALVHGHNTYGEEEIKEFVDGYVLRDLYESLSDVIDRVPDRKIPFPARDQGSLYDKITTHPDYCADPTTSQLALIHRNLRDLGEMCDSMNSVGEDYIPSEGQKFYLRKAGEHSLLSISETLDRLKESDERAYSRLNSSLNNASEEIFGYASTGGMGYYQDSYGDLRHNSELMGYDDVMEESKYAAEVGQVVKKAIILCAARGLQDRFHIGAAETMELNAVASVMINAGVVVSSASEVTNAGISSLLNQTNSRGGDDHTH